MMPPDWAAARAAVTTLCGSLAAPPAGPPLQAPIARATANASAATRRTWMEPIGGPPLFRPDRDGSSVDLAEGPDALRLSATPSGPRPGPATDVRGHGPIPGRAIPPGRRPARVLVLVADP